MSFGVAAGILLLASTIAFNSYAEPQHGGFWMTMDIAFDTSFSSASMGCMPWTLLTALREDTARVWQRLLVRA